jgi:hypothetical protein
MQAAYRAVCWPAGAGWRHAHGLPWHDFHITVGFTPADVHTKCKGIQTVGCVAAPPSAAAVAAVVAEIDVMHRSDPTLPFLLQLIEAAEASAEASADWRTIAGARRLHCKLLMTAGRHAELIDVATAFLAAQRNCNDGTVREGSSGYTDALHPVGPAAAAGGVDADLDLDANGAVQAWRGFAELKLHRYTDALSSLSAVLSKLTAVTVEPTAATKRGDDAVAAAKTAADRARANVLKRIKISQALVECASALFCLLFARTRFGSRQ